MALEQWIWLPQTRYPHNQTTIYSAFGNFSECNYTVAEFAKRYTFEQTPVLVRLRFSADTIFQLFCNDELVATGPASVGGDFLGNEQARTCYYAYETELKPQSAELDFFARVQMTPDRFCHYSMGHGGFMLVGEAIFADGTTQALGTDGSWLARKNGAYVWPCVYDGSVAADAYVQAEPVEDIWHAQVAPIPVREEHKLVTSDSVVKLAPHEQRTVLLDYDKIYAGYFCATSTGGAVQIKAHLRETDEDGTTEQVALFGAAEYRGFFLHSVGNVEAQLVNEASTEATVELAVIATNYPVTHECNTVTSDVELNRVLEVCKHTLKICRQTQHLDSPRHCEPLACTGDYYIESLMTPFSFGDMRLAEFDLVRTAILLENADGRLFHTTYSLIFVCMLRDVYMITGNLSLLHRCEKALRLLLARFERYLGANGLPETPPDYMFVDWIYLDGLSLHHPPKALGQACLSMFCFGALQAAADIFAALSLDGDAADCRNRAEALRTAINVHLFDEHAGMYVGGLNTPTEEHLLGQWMPQNVSKRYFTKHANVLAACFGICDDDTARRLIDEIMSDKIEGDCQPYFLHFLLEAIFRLGLRDRYTLVVFDRWKAPVAACSKGLAEGFVAPEPTYAFDHSHAWGGTPLYSLPKALLGLEILQSGMKKLRLAPSLLGLEHATTTLATPYDDVTCYLQRGKAPVITAPDEVDIELIL